mmetsp:Transcript_44779/g.72922  ORF Transcript_44779/g.72922 Transcript_44779/m.72922 type:complete len:187 (+) Transcript_44779:403-963(+)
MSTSMKVQVLDPVFYWRTLATPIPFPLSVYRGLPIFALYPSIEYSGFTAVITMFSNPTLTPTPTPPPVCASFKDLSATPDGVSFYSNTAVNYPSNIGCAWRITVPADQQIEIHFSTFSTKVEDYVTIYEGFGPSATRIFINSGEVASALIIAAKNVSFITFYAVTSDPSSSATGFTVVAYGACYMD